MSENREEFGLDRAAALAPALRMMLRNPAPGIVTFRGDPAHMRLCRKENWEMAVRSGEIQGIWVPADADLEKQYAALGAAVTAYKDTYGAPPYVIAVENVGLFYAGSDKPSADALADGVPPAGKQGRVPSAGENQAPARARRLEGKIGVVTGGAQGFGYGLAEAMIGEGGYVVLADLNGPLAKEAADTLGKNGRALAVQTDVTDEASVIRLLRETVLAYGGLDIFVNHAGVLNAGGLEEMTKDAFEFVTRVNYTAYFTCVKYASAVMKIQHRFAPEMMMDIIQINSKSGLSGSNKNFAYAGGKFGGIGLVQSFALELIPYNIKVNAVCPGNLLSGPLWTDPEKGLFVQYLNAGKVPGAKTVEDVRRFYESKVPMNRGCEIIDVARACFYVIEQEYETGQALPVTGGQNMLK